MRRLSSVGYGSRRGSVIDKVADENLARMGYKSDLPRSLSMLSVLGLSFAIMAVPYGLSTTMYIGLTDGQSATILYGWVFVSIISLSIAASLAEICAVYPTAGGVYYWSAMMATKDWARIASWVTVSSNLVGRVGLWPPAVFKAQENLMYRINPCLAIDLIWPGDFQYVPLS